MPSGEEDPPLEFPDGFAPDERFVRHAVPIGVDGGSGWYAGAPSYGRAPIYALPHLAGPSRLLIAGHHLPLGSSAQDIGTLALHHMVPIASYASSAGFVGGLGGVPYGNESELCLNLEGIVMNVTGGVDGIFGGGLSAAVGGGSWGGFSNGVRVGGMNDEWKRNLMRIEFRSQQLLYSLGSTSKCLNTKELRLLAQQRDNARTSEAIKEELSILKLDKSDLAQRTKSFERQKVEDRKIDQLLVELKDLREAFEAQNTAVVAGKPAKEVPHIKDPPGTGKQGARTSDKFTCKAYVYGKAKILEFASGKGPLYRSLTMADKTYNIVRKYYPIGVGAVAWYTYGIEWDEVLDIIQMRREANSKKYKQELSGYREAKEKAAEAEAAALAKAAAEAKAAADAEATRADAAKEKKGRSRWYNISGWWGKGN